MSDRVPVAVLGGGAYAARLVEVIASVPDMPALELRLHARDHGRLDVIASHAAARVVALGARHVVGAFPALDGALDGAAAVVLLVRVGGLAARAHDEAFPVRFGQVGDEGVGLGGMASAWRTVPVLDQIAARIAARAPGAHVLNLIAPLGVTTRLLTERGLRTVGLCELPVLTVERWRAWAADEPAPPLAYAGLNHLGFFWCPSCPPLDHPVLRAAVERGEVPGELVLRLGAAPLHYFVDVFEPEAALGLGRRARTRAARSSWPVCKIICCAGSATSRARRPPSWSAGPRRGSSRRWCPHFTPCWAGRATAARSMSPAACWTRRRRRWWSSFSDASTRQGAT